MYGTRKIYITLLNGQKFNPQLVFHNSFNSNPEVTWKHESSQSWREAAECVYDDKKDNVRTLGELPTSEINEALSRFPTCWIRWNLSLATHGLASWPVAMRYTWNIIRSILCQAHVSAEKFRR